MVFILANWIYQKVREVFTEVDAILRESIEKPVRKPEIRKELNDASCPAGLVKVVFAEIPYKRENRVVCVNYEWLVRTNTMPSEKHCPSCKYNTDTLRKEADLDLARIIASFGA